MAFCGNCGIEFADGTIFCRQCGARCAPPPGQSAIPGSPGTIPAGDEPLTLSMLPEAKKINPEGPAELYTLVFSPYHVIMAKLTAEIITDARKKSQERGKAEGKGWLGRAHDQTQATGMVHFRYLEMSPSQILAETPGNLAIEHNGVASVNVRQVYEPTGDEGPGDPYTEVVFNTNRGNFKFRLRMQPRDVLQVARRFYLGRVTG